MNFLEKIFSSQSDMSSKRLIAVILVVVLVVSYFLMMYIKVEIANQALVDKGMTYIFMASLFYGGFITFEQFMKMKSIVATTQADASIQRAQAGVPDVQVTQKVETQNVDTQNVSTDSQAPPATVTGKTSTQQYQEPEITEEEAAKKKEG
jgi:hypothetical protein